MPPYKLANLHYITYRDVRSINPDKFHDDLSQSTKVLQCFDNPAADTYAELMNRELRRLMDRHAPSDARSNDAVKTIVVGCRRKLARTAKHRRRRLERRYRRTANMSDKLAHRDAVVTAHDTIIKSPSDSCSQQLAEADNDQR